MEKKMMSQETSGKKPLTTSIDSNAVQCCKCYKLRYIEAQQMYEEIRSETPTKSFACKRFGEDGSVDVKFDSPNVRWFADRYGIPKTPQGWKRILVIRESGKKADVYYETPQHKRLRTLKEVAKFIRSNQEFKDIKIQELSFVSLKLMNDVVVAHYKTCQDQWVQVYYVVSLVSYCV